MKTNKTYQAIFGPSPLILEETIMLYVEGKLSRSEQHAVEKAMLNDEVLADYIEGLQLLINENKLQESVDAINTHNKSILSKKEVKVIGMARKHFFAIAASLLLLMVSTYFFTTYYPGKSKDSIAFLDTVNNSKEQSQVLDALTNTITQNQSETSEKQTKEEHSPSAKPQQNSKVADAEPMETESAGGAKLLEDENVPNEVDAVAESAPMATKETVQDKVAQTPAADASGNSGLFAHGDAKKESPATLQGKSTSSKKKNASVSTRSEPSQDAPSAATAKDDNDMMQEEKRTKNDFDVALSKLRDGQKLMNETKYEQSISLFDDAMKSGTQAIADEAEWNKALCLLKVNRKSEAEILLKRIISRKNKFSDEAAFKLKSL